MFEAFADGSVRGGNPGFGGIGIVVKHDDDTVQFARLIGDDVTSNTAEYEALIATLEYLVKVNTLNENCIIYTDSALVHGQVIKNWKCNFGHLRVLRDRARDLRRAAPFPIEIKWVSRWSSEIANSLAQEITLEERVRREVDGS